jgi:hypothetical protein
MKEDTSDSAVGDSLTHTDYRGERRERLQTFAKAPEEWWSSGMIE